MCTTKMSYILKHIEGEKNVTHGWPNMVNLYISLVYANMQESFLYNAHLNYNI